MCVCVCGEGGGGERELHHELLHEKVVIILPLELSDHQAKLLSSVHAVWSQASLLHCQNCLSFDITM